jgi:hypothetical protein
MIFSSKSQMIHVISEVVVLIGFTFYFTSKINKLSDDLVKTNQIIKSQNERINYLESMVKHILNKINKPVKIEEPYQNRQPNRQSRPEIKEIKEDDNISDKQENQSTETLEENQSTEETLSETLEENQSTEETLSETLEETLSETLEETLSETLKETLSETLEDDLDKELEKELNELKKEEEKLE